MAPVSAPSSDEYDVVVIGGGSAGSASSVCLVYIASAPYELCKLEHVIQEMI